MRAISLYIESPSYFITPTPAFVGPVIINCNTGLNYVFDKMHSMTS